MKCKALQRTIAYSRDEVASEEEPFDFNRRLIFVGPIVRFRHRGRDATTALSWKTGRTNVEKMSSLQDVSCKLQGRLCVIYLLCPTAPAPEQPERRHLKRRTGIGRRIRASVRRTNTEEWTHQLASEDYANLSRVVDPQGRKNTSR